MNLIVLSLFSANTQGLNGAIYLIIAHAFVAIELFFCIGIIYDSSYTILVRYSRSIAQFMPIFSLLFLFFTLAIYNKQRLIYWSIKKNYIWSYIDITFSECLILMIFFCNNINLWFFFLKHLLRIQRKIGISSFFLLPFKVGLSLFWIKSFLLL